MVYVFICVDFDRDYAYPVKNLQHAVSKPIQLKSSSELLIDPEKSLSMKGTINGFNPFMTYLIEKKLHSTFYFEARTANIFLQEISESSNMLDQPFFEFGVHGYDHEDLTGEDTEFGFSREDETAIIKKAKDELEKLFSRDISGFRAPYMKLTSNTLEILSTLGFIHDSSIYKESDCGINPYKTKEGIMEFPVIKTPKESPMRGMYTYLWPLFENKRSLEDTVDNYLHLVNNTTDDNSFISINLHSWHFAYNIEKNQFLSEVEITKNIRAFETLISTLEKQEEVMFSTPKRWLDENIIL